jgi:hypothetical protein
MQAMAWWSLPLVAFVVAIVWVSVANRPRPPADPHDSMAEHERFRQAMGRTLREGGPAATQPPAAGRDAAGRDVAGRDAGTETTGPDAGGASGSRA